MNLKCKNANAGLVALIVMVSSIGPTYATSGVYEELAIGLLDEVKQLNNAGNTVQAREKLLVVLAADPANADAFVVLGRMAMVDENYEQAAQSLGTALKIDPTRRDLYVELGRSQIALGNENAANETMTQLSKLCDDCVEITVLEDAIKNAEIGSETNVDKPAAETAE